MSDLRFTDTNAADDSAGRVFGLEGNLYLPVVLSAVGSVALIAFLGLFLRANWKLAGTVGALPAALTFGWIVWLRHGKPPGYDRDRIEAWWGAGDFTPTAVRFLGKSHAGPPEARFVQGMVLFGSPERSGVVARGFGIEPGDLRGASCDAWAPRP